MGLPRGAHWTTETQTEIKPPSFWYTAHQWVVVVVVVLNPFSHSVF